MATPGLDIPAQAALAKEYGFDAMDLRVGAPGKGEIPEDMTPQQAAQALQEAEGVAISSLLCYNKNIHAGQEEMVASVLRCLSLAKLLQCPMIRLFSGKIESEEALQTLICVLKRVLAQDDSPVKIALQVHKNNGISVRQGSVICREIENNRVGVILSPDQSILAGEAYLPYLPELARRVHQVYIADMDEKGSFVLIGQGIIDFRKEMQILAKHGFDGLVTLKWEKCWYPDMPDYTQAFPAFLEYYRKHLLPL